MICCEQRRKTTSIPPGTICFPAIKVLDIVDYQFLEEEMPYINNNNRPFLDNHLKPIIKHIDNPGELCYCVYKLMKDLSENDKCFRNMAMIISEIECAKLEFYRRIVSPYEDLKIHQNGDVE